jgi:hypothetical protein
MALADIPPKRLDSWKEIAEYLGRDVRTAARWEAEGLPLHRVPGGRGRSVFAFTSEIDAWMAGKGIGPDSPVAANAEPEPAPSARRSALPPRLVILAGCFSATAVILIGAAVMPRSDMAPPGGAAVRVDTTEESVSIAGESGPARVIHRFASSRGVAIQNHPSALADLDGDGIQEILAGISYYIEPDRSIRSGELLNLSPGGEVRWRFGFGDVLTFGDGRVNGPWALADWQAGPTIPAKFAVAGHDYTWWASIAAVLDDRGRRLGSFVNPGWVESVIWLDKDRVAFAGFNNPRNAAMLAIVDANAADGQAPGTAATPFACASCPARPPLFYATFPRSELNLLTAARFNRARVAVVGDRIHVTTAEIQTPSATAIYEFDRALRLVRARYSGSYWDAHRRFEIEGRLSHGSETCPERDGPAAIQAWTETGWQTIPRPEQLR